MTIQVLAELLFELAFMAVLGYGMRRLGITDDAFQKTLSAVLLRVVIPLSVLGVGNTVYDASMAKNMLWTLLFVAVYYLAVGLLGPVVTRPMRLSGANKKMYANVLMLGNVGYIGLPIATALYGAEGALYCIVVYLSFQFVSFTWGIVRAGGKLSLKSFFTSPMTISPVLAILIFVSPFRAPAFVVDAFSTVGGLSAPFSMFIIGASLARIKFSTLWTDRYAWLATALRQLVLPACVAGILWACGFTGLLPCAAVVVLSMPSATINVIFAEQYGGDLPFVTRSVVHGTMLMVLTLPLWAMVCARLFMG